MQEKDIYLLQTLIADYLKLISEKETHFFFLIVELDELDLIDLGLLPNNFIEQIRILLEEFNSYELDEKLTEEKKTILILIRNYIDNYGFSSIKFLQYAYLYVDINQQLVHNYVITGKILIKLNFVIGIKAIMGEINQLESYLKMRFSNLFKVPIYASNITKKFKKIYNLKLRTKKLKLLYTKFPWNNPVSENQFFWAFGTIYQSLQEFLSYNYPFASWEDYIGGVMRALEVKRKINYKKEVGTEMISEEKQFTLPGSNSFNAISSDLLEFEIYKFIRLSEIVAFSYIRNYNVVNKLGLLNLLRISFYISWVYFMENYNDLYDFIERLRTVDMTDNLYSANFNNFSKLKKIFSPALLDRSVILEKLKHANFSLGSIFQENGYKIKLKTFQKELFLKELVSRLKVTLTNYCPEQINVKNLDKLLLDESTNLLNELLLGDIELFLPVKIIE